MGEFEESIKGLCIVWVAVSPYQYFNDMFMRSTDMNDSFTKAFRKSSKQKAKCYNITQGFFLRHLFQILENDSQYSKFSIQLIQNNIRSHMEHGSHIVNSAIEFDEKINNMSVPQQFVMCYVEKILEILYTERSKRDIIISELWSDAKCLLGVDVITTMAIKQAKESDKMNGRI